MADGTIGKLNVEITGNAAPLQGALKQAEAETQASAQQIGKAIDSEITSGANAAAAGVGGAMKSAGDSVKSAMLPVRAFRAAMLGVVGVAGSVVAAIQALGQVVDYLSSTFGDGTKKAEEFIATLSSDWATNAEANLKALRDRIQEVQSELAFRIENPLDFTGRSMGTIKGELDELERLAGSVADQVNKKILKAREDAIEKARLAEAKAAEDLAKRVAQIDAETRQLNRESMDEKDRLTDEYNEKWDAIYKRMQDAKDSAEKAALQKLLDATTARYGDEYRAFERLEREKTEAANAEAEKRQKAESERMSKMAASYGAELSKAFQSADSANRAASDAMMERMATSVNRLKEIAESNKQATNRGDTSTAGGVW